MGYKHRVKQISEGFAYPIDAYEVDLLRGTVIIGL
jgi:hypothetical protein